MKSLIGRGIVLCASLAFSALYAPAEILPPYSIFTYAGYGSFYSYSDTFNLAEFDGGGVTLENALALGQPAVLAFYSNTNEGASTFGYMGIDLKYSFRVDGPTNDPVSLRAQGLVFVNGNSALNGNYPYAYLQITGSGLDLFEDPDIIPSESNIYNFYDTTITVMPGSIYTVELGAYINASSGESSAFADPILTLNSDEISKGFSIEYSPGVFPSAVPVPEPETYGIGAALLLVGVAFRRGRFGLKSKLLDWRTSCGEAYSRFAAPGER